MTIESPAAPPSTIKLAPRQRRYLDLFLISFTILFFELSCIRFFGSTVVFLTFFTNIVLMACFLGMSIGLLTSSRKTNLIRTVIPFWFATVIAAIGLLMAYNRFSHVTIDVGSQASPQQIFFGTEYRPKDPSQFVIPIELVAGFFFVLIAMTFVGLGQVMGRTFDAIPNRVAAYTVDVLGSLSGIVAFAVASFFCTTPLLWFSVCALLFFYFLRPLTWGPVLIAAVLITLVGLYAYGVKDKTLVLWSPYYKINYNPEVRSIDTNNIGHQAMATLPYGAPAYMLPHQLAFKATGRVFDNVLIIGAGSGNDVAAALLAGAKHIDAVEIDPVINQLGRTYHPNQPYSDPRVTVHLNDGRSFVRTTRTKYDLVVYAVVDSLVLHSGYSSLRLESFLFTQDAFRDVKKVLKPDGVFATYNYYRQGWVVGRVVTMARAAIGGEPLVISMPYQPVIRSTDNQIGRITFILTDSGHSTVEAIRAMLQKEEASPTAPTGSQRARGIRMSHVDTNDIGPIPSDNWPFLYLRNNSIPTLNLHGMAIIIILSLLMLLIFAPTRTLHLNWTMFFLGAGFMLLETKGVVHMALLFGATWVVNSIVFAAILVMILCANLFVLWRRPNRLLAYYALLAAVLLINALVPMNYFLALPGMMKIVSSCAMVFVPVFFAGVIFATLFRDSINPGLDFGSNVAGIIVGGLSEYFSLVFGFNGLIFIALGFYLLSFAASRTRWSPVPRIPSRA
jgi:spermidine synthase